MASGHEKIRPYGLSDCESLLSRLPTGRIGTGEFPSRHFRSTADALESGDLGNVAGIPGADNPADGLARAEGDLGPFFHLPETGIFRPGRLEQLRGVSLIENA